MAIRNPYEQYRQNQVFTTPPEELVLMLYDGAIRFIKRAVKEIEEKNVEECHKNIVKVEAIIAELMSNLDMNVEISNSLYSLYDYMHRRLTDANLQKDSTILNEVLELILDLRNTWEQAIKIAKQQV